MSFAAALARHAEVRAQRELGLLPAWVWDGVSLPVPVVRIVEEHYGLLVQERDSLLEFASDGEAHVSGVLLTEVARILVDRLEAARAPGRKRFTVAHELGHLVLHSRAHVRRSTPSEPPTGVPRALRYLGAELEANQFAAALLMPAGRIDVEADTPMHLVERFAVSAAAAEVRLEYLRWS